jgi:adenylate cyclase
VTSEALRDLTGLCGRHRPAPVRADRSLVEQVTHRCTAALIAANVAGAAIVLALGLFAVPEPDLPPATHSQLQFLSLVAFAVVLPVSLVVGYVWSRAVARRATEWLREGREPTEEERRTSLRYPLYQAGIDGVLWAVAVAVFTAGSAPYSTTVAVESGLEITLGGLVTCAIVYLLTEKLSRPVTTRILERGVPEEAVGHSVRWRLMFAWAFGSAVPLVGVALFGLAVLADVPASNVRIGVAVVLFAVVGLLAGMVTVKITARLLADPLRALRSALERVERGELDTSLPVSDASELGQVQAGFNQMARGLLERDRLRDLFGRHVGEEVAASALERGEMELGGETREAAVLFVDLIGSTSLASTRQPDEVVAELNAFFAVVVDCVSLHGGWVNKFEGDAALCVFGAPSAHPDAAGSALAAARALSVRIDRELRGLAAGIGVSAGPVVAGNVGAAERYEYTVIGDPVNEAARLTELAKSEPGRVLASAAALRMAGEREREHWTVGRSVTLRGRRFPTSVAAPRVDAVALASSA